MRRSYLTAIATAAAMFTACGCRQTAGTPGANVMTPISPMGAATGQSPIIPFGGSTRVPPPTTGSMGTANNYLGGAAPTSASVSYPANGYGQSPSVAEQFPVGSGLAAEPNGAAALANTSQPQLSGMRVNDLTNAPPPPGYRASTPTYPQDYAPVQPAGGFQPLPTSVSPAAHQQPYPNVDVPSAPYDSNGMYSNGMQTRHLPASTNSINTAGNTWQSSSAQPTGRPSTDPVTSGMPNVADNQLPWRTPAPKF